MTTDDLRARIEKPYVTRFWGSEYTITPLLVDEVFGDGQLLMGIQPLNTRPNYYVVRVDSRWSEECGSDKWFDLLDEQIYDAIADQFGASDDEDDDGHAVHEGWPALDLDAGCSWFEYVVDDDPGPGSGSENPPQGES